MSDTAPAPDAPEGGKGIKALLSRKIGPLPAGAWLLAVVGGVGVAVVIRRRALAQEAALPADETAEGIGDGWDQADPGGTLPGVGGSAPIAPGAEPPAPSTPNAPGPNVNNGGSNAPSHPNVTKAKAAKTNAEWRKWTIEAMVVRQWNRGNVSDALADYIAGRSLTARQASIVGAATALCGPPPQPIRRRGMDTDRDGIRNAQDRDVDGDGKRNRRDRDDDGDGVPDSRDRYPRNPRRH